MRENALNHRWFFDYGDILSFPPHAWQCSISISKTRLNKRAQLIRTGALWACMQSPSCECPAAVRGAGTGTTFERNFAFGASTP